MQKDNDGDIILTDNEIISIIKDDTNIFSNKNKVFSQNNKMENNNLFKTINFDKIPTYYNYKENKLTELENKINTLFESISYIKNKIDIIESIYIELKSLKRLLTNKNIYIQKINKQNNPFNSEDNDRDEKEENTSEEKKIIKSINNKTEISNENKIGNNLNIIKRKYYFILKSQKKNQIGEIYDEVKDDEDFINAVFLKENNNDNYYLLIRFKTQKTIDISFLKDFQNITLGNRASVALTELTKFCKIICDVKQENIEKDIKGYDIVNGLYK